MCTCGCGQVLLECNHVGCQSSDKMRNQLQAAIDKGDNDDLILQGFVQEYGPTVIAAPTATGFNRVAWIMPFAVLALGIVFVTRIVLSWKDRPAPALADGIVIPQGEDRRIPRAGPQGNGRMNTCVARAPPPRKLLGGAAPGSQQARFGLTGGGLMLETSNFIRGFNPRGTFYEHDPISSAPSSPSPSFYYVFFFPGEVYAGEEKTRLGYLRERKESVYENLRDLNFEYKAGKVPDTDYQSMRSSLEEEAAAIMAEIARLEQAVTL